MSLPEFSSLQIAGSTNDRIVAVTIDHGRVNEMGSTEITDWEHLTQWLNEGQVQAVITRSTKRTSKGTPIFIAGANVTERADWSDTQVRAHVRRQRAALAQLRRAPVFHIGIVEGLALGWGTEFLIACDYRIATPEARFALPETGIGILPGAGGTAELPRIVGINQALRLGMTGERISADEACRIGLVDEVVADGAAALGRAQELAEQVARRSPTAVAAYKTAVLAAQVLPDEQRTELEAQAYELCVESGEAAIGRANFKAITSGEAVEWGPRQPLKP